MTQALDTALPAASSASETQERILDAAEALFAERGFAGTSVRDIAGAAELTPASLYNHFAGKEGLYEAVLERGLAPLLLLLQRIAVRPLGAATVDIVIPEVMEYLARRPHLPRLIHQEAVSGGGRLTERAGQAIRPLLEQGIAAVEGDPAQGFSGEEAPLFIAAWLYLVFGHFAMAPLMRNLLPDEPLSQQGLARQTRFLCRLGHLLSDAGRPASGDAP